MKWIGQNIYDKISRFRDDVYLEDISSGTIASGGNLGLDSNNKIVKQSDTGITDLHGAGVDGSNNQVLTDDGDGTITSEAYLTFENAGNVSTLSLKSNQDNTDLLSIATTTNGATTLTTVDGDAGSDTSNFEIAANGSITLDAAGHINLETASGGYNNDASSIMYSNAQSVTYDSAHVVTFISSDTTNPLVTIKNTSSGANSGILNFVKDKGAAGADGDDIGQILFTGDDAAQAQTNFGQILVEISEADNTDEAGKMTLSVAESDGTTTALSPGLILEGEHGTDGEVDVTIANGTGSTTTVAGAIAVTSGATISNPSAGATAALIVDNDDVDQIAVDIDAVNTTANIIDVNAQALTTGNAIFIDSNGLTTGSAISIDVDDALTTAATKSLLSIDYDKSGITPNEISSITTGVDVNMADAATNQEEGQVQFVGFNATLDAANVQGGQFYTGYQATITDITAAAAVGYYSNVEDGGFDFKAVSSANTADYFTIAVGEDGETTLTTNENGGGSTAHFEIAADGNITLDPAGTIALEANTTVTGDLTVNGTRLTLDHATRNDIKFTNTGDEDHYIRKDGDFLRFRGHDDSTVILELKNNTNGSNAASFPNGTLDVGGAFTCASRTLAVSGSTDGDHNGDVVYFGGTTSMTTGAIYHYKSDGTWELADADAASTSDGLLGVALGAASDTNGVLLRGMVTIDHDPGAIGDVLYLSTTAGDCSSTAPSGNGDIVRIIGYQVSHASNGNIWFNPDGTFVEISA